MDQWSKKLLGGGIILLAAGILARETFAWAWGLLLSWVLFPSSGPGSASMNASFPWESTLALVLFVVGIAVIIWSFKRGLPSPESFAAAAPLIEFGAQLHALTKGNPWLGFWGTGYNGSDYPLAIRRATGKIRIGGEHLQGQLELAEVMDANRDEAAQIAPHSFFIFALQLPLTKTAAESLIPIQSDGFAVIFVDAKLEAAAISKRKEQPFSIAIPKQLSFDATGQPQPTFFNQVHSS